jgi:hypothetical protein
MTRLLNDGAEMRDIIFWDSVSGGSPGISVVNTTIFSSPYYYYLAGAGQSASCYKSISALSECYFRARVSPTAYGTNLRMPAFSLTGTVVAYVTIDVNGHLAAYVTTVGLVGTSTTTWTYATWCLLEVYFKEANAPNGRFVVMADGDVVIDYTGDTQPGADTTFNTFGFVSGSSSAHLCIDDIAINDTVNTDGKNDNSYCGDGIITKITPSGTGTTNDWTGNDGDSTDNHLLVDEYPSDGDTTYVYHDGAVGSHQEQYAMSDVDLSTKTIKRIYSEVRAKKSSAQSIQIKTGFLASGGTDQLSAAQSLTTGSYTRVVGDQHKTNPVDSGAWEDADIDALEFVMETVSPPA